MDAMMYKIEGEDLYLIGTSEHSMIGKSLIPSLQKTSFPRRLPVIHRASERKRERMVLRTRRIQDPSV